MTAVSNGCHAAFLQFPMTPSQDGRRLHKFTNAARVKDFEREHHSLSHTGVAPISRKQSLTPHQLYPPMRGI